MAVSGPLEKLMFRAVLDLQKNGNDTLKEFTV